MKFGRRGATFVSVLALQACAAEPASDLTLGLSTDLAFGFDLHRVEVSTSVEGEATVTSRFGGGEQPLPALLALPSQAADSEVKIIVRAFRKGETSAFLERAATVVAPASDSFLTLELERACLEVDCGPASTCVAGSCVAVLVDDSQLEAANPAWLEAAPDACRPEGLSVTPSLTLGKGQSMFEPLEELSQVPIEPGAQGGYHLWLALQSVGLRQAGSVLTVRARYPELGFELPPFESSINLRTVKNSDACEIYGVRLQVDRGIEVEQVRGMKLELEVELSDAAGGTALAQQSVVVAP